MPKSKEQKAREAARCWEVTAAPLMEPVRELFRAAEQGYADGGTNVGLWIQVAAVGQMLELSRDWSWCKTLRVRIELRALVELAEPLRRLAYEFDKTPADLRTAGALDLSEHRIEAAGVRYPRGRAAPPPRVAEVARLVYAELAKVVWP